MTSVGPNEFSAETARAALRDILAAFTTPSPENDRLKDLAEARDAAGNDLVKHMQLVFPVLARIQMEEIASYGFASTGEGVIAFTHAVRALERDHPDVALLSAELQAYYVPPMVPPAQNSDYDG